MPPLVLGLFLVGGVCGGTAEARAQKPALKPTLKPAVEMSGDGRVRLIRENAKSPTGKLLALTGGPAKIVALNVARFWSMNSGQDALYATRDRAGGGFESEGQALFRYNVDTGVEKVLYVSRSVITNITEARTKTGRLVWLVTSKDTAMGAPTAAVVDPRLGMTWERRFARFGPTTFGAVAVATLPSGEPKGGDFGKAKPLKIESLDLESALTFKPVLTMVMTAQPPVGGSVVTGTVTYRERMALPPDAVIEVTLADVSQADAPMQVIGKQTIKPAGKQVPIPFSLAYDPKKIVSGSTYAVSARIAIGGKLVFLNDTRYPVITRGAPTKVDMILKRVSASGGTPTAAKPAKIPLLAPEIRSGKLENGLTYFIRRNNYPAQKAEMRLVVNAGSILESEEQRGLAHFLEHMMFNGTPSYPKNELVNYLQGLGIRFGADLNAYTSFDETVYILPVPTTEKENFDKGLEILKEWAGDATLAEDEIDKERGVVLSELRDGKGPQERLRKKYFPRLLNNSRYAERIPIGDEDVLKNFTPDKVRSFYKQWYRPDLQAVIIVGDVDVDATEKKIRDLFGQLKNPENPTPRPAITPIADREKADAMVLTDKEVSTAQAQIINYVRRRQPIADTATYRAYLTDQLFNQMMNARLYEVGQRPDRPFLFAQSARGPLGIRGYDALQVFSATSGDPAKTANVLTTEIERARRFGFTEPELARAKAEVLKQYETSAREKDKAESGGLANELITHFLEGDAAPGVVWEYDFARQTLPAISLADINAQKERLTTDPRVKPFTLITAPTNGKTPLPSDAQLLTSLNAVRAAKITGYTETATAKSLLPKAPIPGVVTATDKNERDGTITYTFSNGVLATLKTTDFKNDQILFGGTRYGGYLLYDAKDKDSAEKSVGLVGAMGYGAFSPTQLQRLLTGRNVNVQTSLTPYADNVSGSSGVKDFEAALQLLYLKMTAPRKDEALFRADVAQTKATLATLRNNPDAVMQDAVYEILANGNPYAYRIDKPEDLDKVALQRVMEIYRERFSNAYGYHFYFVGSLKPEMAKPLLAKYLGGLPAAKYKPAFKDRDVRAPKGKIEKTINKGTEEKANVLVMYREEVAFNPVNDLQMDALSSIMENKVIDKIREEMGSAYSPYAGGSLRRLPIGNSIVQFVIGCTPAQVPAVEKAIADISADLRDNGPNAVDMSKMKAAFRQKNRVDLKTNDYWLGRLLEGYDDPATAEAAADYAKRVDALTPADIQSAATKYLAPANVIQVVMLPEPK